MSDSNVRQLPRLVIWFLRITCPEALFEEIEGDLIQRYNADRRSEASWKATFNLYWNALWYIRPGILFRNRIRSLLSLELLLNYFKVTSRIMLRNKAFTLINVSGLTLGMTGALLLFIWINHEFSYEDFHRDPERIYTAYNRATIEGEKACWPYTPRILAPTLRDEYPALEQAISVAQWGDPYLLQAGDVKLTNDRGIFTEAGFFDLFNFPLLHGHPAQAFNEPSSIVINKTLAGRLFPGKNALGESVTVSAFGYDFDFTVTGILDELPENTQFSFDYIIPFAFLESLEGRDEEWLNNSVSTYVRLDEHASLETLNESLSGIIHRHTGKSSDPEIFLYPLQRMHMYGQFENGIESGGKIRVFQMLIILAVFLLIIASINFINLSTARAGLRAREIGVRKVNGARRSALISQFLMESALLTVIAFGCSLGLAFFLLPGFNKLVGVSLMIPVGEGWFWRLCLAMAGGLCLLAGTYPALALSSFRPTVIFHSSVKALGGSFRKGLVILQFGFALTMIFSVVVISEQIRYVQNRQAGYDKQHLIFHPVSGQLARSSAAYRNELLRSGIARSVSFTASKITEDWSSTYAMQWPGKEEGERVMVNRYVVDDQLVQTAGLRIIEGRNLDFSRYPSDSTGALINEAAVREMNLEDPVGAIIQDDARRLTVVGVVEDFVLKSPLQQVEPILLIPNLHWNYIANIRLRASDDLGESLAAAEEIYRKYEPDYPFEFEFVDEVYAAKFSSLRKTERIAQLASFIIILIACLGLYGLTLFTVQQRLQEVSIRRIFGGSVGRIMRLLCWRSVRPVCWAILVFSPLAWFSMQWWLQSFDYRIALELRQVLLTGGMLLAVSLITIIYQIWQTSNINPAKVLKRE